MSEEEKFSYEPLTQEWREEHVMFGDKALILAHKLMAELDEEHDENPQETLALTSLIQLAISAAQAHYLAANVRARHFGTQFSIHGTPLG